MGGNQYIPVNNSLSYREAEHKALFSAIHRARVSEIHIDKGTVTLSLESVVYTQEVTMPLLGLSAPPDLTSDAPVADFKSASWGRYIPQVGDVLLVGFDMNGTLYSLGYASIFYRGFNLADEGLEDQGGISWGESSEKRLKPGDWDFKSARESSLYLGNQARLASGQNSFSLNRDTGDIIVNTPLLSEQIGVSTFRYGAVRRTVLPTDTSESYIYTSRLGTIAQESTQSVKWLGTPLGSVLAHHSIGDVVEQTSGVYTLKLSGATVPLPVRKWFTSTDITGYLTTYDEEVDSLGNYLVTADTAVDFKWSTTLAAWDISNLSTTISSTAFITLDSLRVALGSSTAVDAVIKGTTSVSGMSSYLEAIAVIYESMAAASTGPIAALNPGFTALALAARTYKATLTNTLSTKVFTV